jgi:heme-degrading monooxygenase HmoA
MMVDMILERVELPVIPGQETAFEAAFAKARLIIAASPGFISLRLSRGLERPSTYLLLVEWERLEDHMEGFRGSPAFQEWRAQLHHFYDPAPMVEHFQPLA